MPINPAAHPNLRHIVNDINANEKSALAVLVLAILDVLTADQLALVETILSE